MTKIDFYIAPESDSDNTAGKDHHQIACRIIEKAYRRNLSVYVHTDNQDDAVAIDQLLWSFRANSFIPHSLDDDSEALTEGKADIPEVLISANSNPRHHTDVLVNVSTQLPDFFARFLRLAEIVSSDNQARTLSRERYKFYRERGYPLNIHQL